MSVKIILVEEHDVIRQSIRSLLDRDPGIEIAAEACNGPEALEQCGRLPVDVVVTGIDKPGPNGFECTRSLKKQFPYIKVLMLSTQNFDNYLVDLLRVGADGYLLKNSCQHDLAFAIKKLNLGGMYIGPEFTMSMLERYKPETSLADYMGPMITRGEMQVLELIAEGLTNIQIANRLITSVRTIESRRKKLIEKTSTVNTATLIKFSIKHNLIK